MVVDEPTASLNATTEKAVQKGLEEVLGGHMGTLIITHRLSTVRRLCTKFFILRDSEGLVPGESQLEASAGSYEELYEISPTFRMLADDQGVAVLDSPHPHVETSPEPVSDAGESRSSSSPRSPVPCSCACPSPTFRIALLLDVFRTLVCAPSEKTWNDR